MIDKMKAKAAIVAVVTLVAAVVAVAALKAGAYSHSGDQVDDAGPNITETAQLTFAPNVPPPITRRQSAILRVNLVAKEVTGTLMDGVDKPTMYRFWTFNGHVPGPFIRARVGDVLEVHLTNDARSTMPHNVDFHAVTGPGGGTAVDSAQPGQTVAAQFKLLHPGLFIYHCATPPVPYHIANGMYGLLLVEPADGLPAVDKEFYVMQSEFYTSGPFGAEGLQAFDPQKAEDEKPTYVVFNGKVGSMLDQGALQVRTNDKVRLFVGNIGPNLVSSFHVIGTIFDKVYKEGSLTSDPERDVQTTLIPAGGSAVVEFSTKVPGTYTLVDHSIFRIMKGAIGQIQAVGPDRPDIYSNFQW